LKQEHGKGETVVHLLAGMPWHNAILVDRIFKKKELSSVAMRLKSDYRHLIAMMMLTVMPLLYCHIRNAKGQCILHSAIEGHNLELVQALSQRKTVRRISSNLGETALHTALRILLRESTGDPASQPYHVAEKDCCDDDCGGTKASRRPSGSGGRRQDDQQRRMLKRNDAN
jgi:hypothetical protein